MGKLGEQIARRGMEAQRDDGVNPERGGYDVSYQMYGAWLAQLYYATLAPGSLKSDLGATIDRAIAWMSTRVDDQTGQVDIGASTRVCNRRDLSQPYEAADAVRVFLTWGIVRDRKDLIDRAVLIDRGAKSPGNPCPEREPPRRSGAVDPTEHRRDRGVACRDRFVTAVDPRSPVGRTRRK